MSNFLLHIDQVFTAKMQDDYQFVSEVNLLSDFIDHLAEQIGWSPQTMNDTFKSFLKGQKHGMVENKKCGIRGN